MSSVVTNLPFGQSVDSSTRTCPPPSFTRRVAHGSGTQAPSIEPAWNACRVVALSCGTTDTSPPPVVVVLYPWLFSHVRSATSCVLPSCGLASFVPLSWLGLVIEGFTTRNAPPDASPEMILIAVPCDFCHALIAGLGPTYVASRPPERSAFTASGPALN